MREMIRAVIAVLVMVVVCLSISAKPGLAKSSYQKKISAAPSTKPVSYDRSKQWGAGVVLGDPSGITVKYWQDESIAWNFGIGAPLAEAGVGLYADYLIHLRVFEEAQEAPVYIGGGFFIGGSENTVSTGARGVIGITYLFEEPFDVFFELSPKFSVAPALDFTMSLAIGGRIYF